MWESDAISLNAFKYGENDAILEVFSRKHGRVSAFVYGGASKKKRALLEPSHIINLNFIAKSENQLGYFDRIESLNSIENLIMDRACAYAASSICALLRDCLPEAMPYENLFDATKVLISSLGKDEKWPAAYIRWEMGLLANAGFGLDLSECALTGSKDNLAWVSPKTGRAASYEAGLPYQDKLLSLPSFLHLANSEIKQGDVADGFALMGWFLDRDLLGQNYKELPQSRGRLIITLGNLGQL